MDTRTADLWAKQNQHHPARQSQLRRRRNGIYRPRYELTGVVESRSGNYPVVTEHLDTHLVPKKPQRITVGTLHDSGRGVGYTKSPFAYLLTRVA